MSVLKIGCEIQNSCGNFVSLLNINSYDISFLKQLKYEVFENYQVLYLNDDIISILFQRDFPRNLQHSYWNGFECLVQTHKCRSHMVKINCKSSKAHLNSLDWL